MAKTACVIGAGGYIASWIVAKLLDRGYIVHGTVRDPDDDKKYGHLKRLQGAEERLTLFKVDVLDQESILPAVRGCDVVFHTACPVSAKFDDPDQVVRPAVDGTTNVMQACHRERIKRVIFTSSAAAMFYNPNRPADQMFDESCWTDPEYAREQQRWYIVAKTESEKLVFQLGNELGIHVISICPGYVFGPILQGTINASVEILSSLINGSQTRYQNTLFQVVDVRDVADAHVAGYEDPNASERYYCITYCYHFSKIVQTLKEKFPQYSYPDKCEGELEGIPAEKLSNKKLLSLIKEPIPFEKMLVDTVTSLQEKGLL